jgi:hypothetical protein
MVSGEDVNYLQQAATAAATASSSAEATATTTEADRDQALANIAASISNRAVGGKLILKANPRQAKRTG